MRDPIDELENFTSPGLTMDPMPAAEVRRRGTRMRRRRTALATAGGVLAIALIAAPLALITGHRDGSEPQPAKPTPSVSWVQSIPADFPLTEGMPDGTEQSGAVGVQEISTCGNTAWSPRVPAPIDRLGASYAEAGSEGTADRTLALYPDGATAAQAYATLHDFLVSCPTDSADSGTTLVNDVVDADLGTDASFVFTNQALEGGLRYDLTLYEVARSGNALLIASSHTSAGGDQVVTTEQERVSEQLQPALSAMCVFSSTGCGSTSTAVDPTPDGSAGVTTAPADFPLLDGLPTRAATEGFGRYGPDQDRALLTVRGCGVKMLDTPAPADWTRGGWHDPAEARERQLVVYDSVAEATAYVGSFEDLITCQPEDLDDGVTRILSGAGSDLGLGDQAVIGVTWYRQDGKPAPGFRVTEMVRVGNAVVVQDRIADGLNDLVTSAYLEQIIDESDQSLPGVVSAMCVFSDAGC